MTYIYLASPYTHPDESIREERFIAVCKAAAWLAGQDKAVYSPIGHWHLPAKWAKMPTDYEFWLNQSLAMILPAHTVMVLTINGWDVSKGVASELRSARMYGKQIAYLHKSTHQDGVYYVGDKA